MGPEFWLGIILGMSIWHVAGERVVTFLATLSHIHGASD
jgi:ABC-type polysaccharide transport system permease subunit